MQQKVMENTAVAFSQSPTVASESDQLSENAVPHYSNHKQ